MIFDNPLEQQKIEKANELRELGRNPYPHFLSPELTIKDFKEKFAYIKEQENQRAEDEIFSLAGRIMLKRVAGKSTFANIEDESDNIQIYFSKDSVGEENYNITKKYFEVGDIILVSGYPFITKTGEFSLHVSKIDLASKCISTLPEKFHGLTDKEMRYRQRYLDMIMNRDVKNIFVLRSKIVSIIRRYFEDKGFLEVETPMLHPIAGGANAKPFITHHNALGVNRFLRIAPELYLKRLVVGGMGPVFEINRCFRNEGMDLTHNPEFTTIEWYYPYKTYFDLMEMTKELFYTIFDKLGLEKKLNFGDKEINFDNFSTIKYLDSLVKIGGLDENIINDREKILEKLKSDGIEVNKNLDLGHLQAELFDNYVEDKLIDPTFVIDFPISISPLSRRSDENKELAERFELFIAGKEVANGFNELNDPIDQYERFKAQIESKSAGNDEAHEMDEDYCRALAYAMPPTAGEGIGIDRLVMMLTNSTSIRDVIAFPAMRPFKED